MNIKTQTVRSDRTLSSPIDGELVLFDSETGKYYGFNEIATKIRKNLDAPKTIEMLYQGAYPEPPFRQLIILAKK